jgi:hypothetical protein
VHSHQGHVCAPESHTWVCPGVRAQGRRQSGSLQDHACVGPSLWTGISGSKYILTCLYCELASGCHISSQRLHVSVHASVSVRGKKLGKALGNLSSSLRRPTEQLGARGSLTLWPHSEPSQERPSPRSLPTYPRSPQDEASVPQRNRALLYWAPASGEGWDIRGRPLGGRGRQEFAGMWRMLMF